MIERVPPYPDQPTVVAVRCGAEVRALLANSEYLAELCVGQACEDPANPILDFDKARCVLKPGLLMVKQW